MLRRSSVIAVLWTFATVIAPAAAQPSNNTCANAIVLALSVERPGNNFNATPDIAASGCSVGDSADVWFAFTATTTGTHTIDTFGSQLDTTLAAYTACGGAQLACNDDESCPDLVSSLISLELNAGQSIRLRVAGFNDEEGFFVITVFPPATLSTGACCAATMCAVLPATQCIQPGSLFVGANTVCNAPGNFTSPCCKADINQNGSVTLQDIFDYLTLFFSESPAADINSSGSITVQDIFDFLTAYFGGC